jgi:hypothetical protein
MSIALRVVAVLCAALALTACGRSASYRYKLALTLDTPDGVKTASNVVEINASDVILPRSGHLQQDHRTSAIRRSRRPPAPADCAVDSHPPRD